MNIVLIGEESAGIQVLRALAESDHTIVAVLASSDTGNAGVWNAANRMGLPTWSARLVKNPALRKRIKDEKVDLILNVHSLFILPQALLDSARLGAFNLHPGILPEYAGLNTVSWAIYHQEKHFGVTLHRMVPRIDGGQIAYQEIYPIEPEDNALTLSIKAVKAGVPLVMKLLDTAEKDPEAIPRLEQDFSKRMYFGRKDKPNNGRVDWAAPAGEVYNLVRAYDYSPFSCPMGPLQTELNEQDVELFRVALTGMACTAPPGTVHLTEEGHIWVACLDEWVRIRKALVEGKRIQASTFEAAVP